MKEPKVLIISHNVLSKDNNMGKTMSDLLSVISSENLAQLYFHSEIPTLDICHRYYRVTDRNILDSLIRRKAKFKIFEKKDIKQGHTSRVDKGVEAKVYQFSRKRTPMIYLARNLLWKLGVWESKELYDWISEFNPDIIFYASGDYSFSYQITYKIAKKFNLPVIMWCCDDHYLSLKKSLSPLYYLNKNHLIKWAKKVASQSRFIITISDKMKSDYASFFNKDVEILRISAKPQENNISFADKKGIIYAGNLGVNRLDPLLTFAKEIKETEFKYIDVYSNERDEKKLALLTLENGIRFHGAVAFEELSSILSQAKYLLHVEAFDDVSKLRTRYSLSTKIGESLQSGVCLIAYGPDDISSMEYLSSHDAALIVNDIKQLSYKLNNMDENEYMRIVNNAKELAHICHNKEDNDKKMFKLLFGE